jgi:hypothetical protein
MNKAQVQAAARQHIADGQVISDHDLAFLIWDARFDSQIDRDTDNGTTFSHYENWIKEL